ncbi:sporulation histidine kinase inhibitor Sda [Virgibacillus necropolis]|uniref:sporulation histidine kinase inhibitor Sda n=1 Tax=Virgibacillus necropolis TaxID=163877 RepID=UPI003850051E
MMQCLSDNTLIDTYNKALELNLNEAYIELLMNEINRRGIDHTRLLNNNDSSYVNKVEV